MCASDFGFFSYLNAVVQNCTLLPIWFSLKYKRGQCEYLNNSIAVRAFLSAHKPFCFGEYCCTVKKDAAPRMASFGHVACATIPRVCSLPCRGLFTQTFSFMHITTSWLLFLGGGFFAISLQMPLPGKLATTVSISGSWPSFHSHDFTCSILSSYLHAAS